MNYARIMIAAVGLVSLTAVGCGRPQRVYTVYAEHHETVRGRLDAQWFRREVYDDEGVSAVELVYCPIVPNTVVGCRTAVVWARGHSALTGTTAR